MRKSLFLFLSALTLASSLSACSEDKKDNKECDPATYGVNNSGSQCAPDVADLMTLYYCTADGRIAHRNCENGCNRNTGLCYDISENNCAAGNVKWKCSDDGKTSSGCRNNKEAVDTCNYGCDTSTGRCKSAPCEENSYQCTSDKKYQKCVDGNWNTVEACDPSNENIICDINLDGCVDLTPEPTCYRHCDADALTLITCDQNDNEIRTDCTVGCVNADCVSDSCDSSFSNTCRTASQKLSCSNNKVVVESCPSSQLCVDGECKNKDATEDCTWSGSICSYDKRHVLTCTNGTASSKLCDNGYTCVAGETNDDADCVKAYTGDTISKTGTPCNTDIFIPYCGSVSDSTYPVNTIECVNGTISTKGCADNRICEVTYDETISIECRAQKSIEKLNIGDTCPDEDKFAETPVCIHNNVPAHCDSSTGKLVAASEKFASGCSVFGMICSVTNAEELSGVPTANCYDPCTVEDTVKKTCDTYGDNQVYSVDQICTDLGDGQLGYVWIENTFQNCDITCSEGVCTDYTTEIPNVGESCDLLPNKNSYCLNDEMLVECRSYTDENDNEKEMIAGEKCLSYEKCTTVDDVAKCRQTCKQGDAPKTSCTSLLNNDFVVTTNCTEVNGTYVYVDSAFSSWKKCSNICEDGACK